MFARVKTLEKGLRGEKTDQIKGHVKSADTGTMNRKEKNNGGVGRDGGPGARVFSRGIMTVHYICGGVGSKACT